MVWGSSALAHALHDQIRSCILHKQVVHCPTTGTTISKNISCDLSFGHGVLCKQKLILFSHLVQFCSQIYHAMYNAHC